MKQTVDLTTEVASPGYVSENTNNGVTQNDQITLTGQLKKEEIPVELKLGKYWYWFYFDQPFLLKDNASGKPQTIIKIQVVPETNSYDTNEKQNYFDNYIDKKITIQGYLSWGYSESRTIVVQDIKEF